MDHQTSVLVDYLNNQNRVVYAPCKNLRLLKVGEKVTVNWFPAGETRPATIVSISARNLPTVRLDHDGALLEIQSREQINWNEKLHSKAR